MSGTPLKTAGSAFLRAASTANLTRIRVGGVPEHFNTPWHTAIAAGRFEDAGLQVEWSTFPGGTGAMTKALRDDTIDVALVLTEGIVADLLRGNPSKLLGTYVSTPLTWGVHVSATSDWQDVAELQHAKYAVSRMGSGSHLMAMVHAQQRGWQPDELKFELVGDLEGARKALAAGSADAFMWEKFTTKHLVDSGEWRRIGEVPTPWPCFSLAASNKALEAHSEALVTMLKVLKQEVLELRASENVCETIANMYGQQEEDVAEWLTGVEWCCQPVVSHSILDEVMSSLVSAGVLQNSDVKPAAELVSAVTTHQDM